MPVRRVLAARRRPQQMAKVAGLLPGRDPYHPNQRQQRRILRTDPRRARVVAGESAKVSELRQQWRDTTVGENRQRFRPVRHPPGACWRWHVPSTGSLDRNTNRPAW